MSMKELPQWLIENKGFKKKLRELTMDSVRSQFDSVRKNGEEEGEIDISYMLTCASLLAYSNENKCQEAALRIAQYCLQSEVPKNKKDGAALILDALVNNATIRLAEKRNMLDSGYEQRIPLSAQLESTKRRILHTINLSDESKIIANKFQSEFWDSAIENSWISVSAPTSVGKSFILEIWIQEYLINYKNNLVIYLVPTRALISEVENDLISRLDPLGNGSVNVASMPLNSSYIEGKPNALVFTQERLHIFLNSFTSPPKIDVLIVDEAHKIGDGYRGVFLQQVIESVTENNRDVQVIFASPFTANPEVLLEDVPFNKSSKSLRSSDITVNQNLIWVTQKPRKPKEWNMGLCFQDELVSVGEFSLKNSPSSESKRLPFVAMALSNGGPGNIIYVNGAAEAEKTATQIYNMLDDSDKTDDEISRLIELCEKTIHKNFKLNKTLSRGVAFHYGNMPLLVKTEIERLFSKNKIRYLICTSTLVEGVNMSCKNIFIRGPKKGNRTLMSTEDFWNLAGRAGRWGKEFQGNVICVDSNIENLWLNGEPPKNKSGIKISRTIDKISNDISSIVGYIYSDNHLTISMNTPELEHVFSYLVMSQIKYGSLASSPYLKRIPRMDLEDLEEIIIDVIGTLTFPLEVIIRNPGISPLLMQELYNRFSSDPQKKPERLLLADPSSDDALSSYVAAFTRISDNLSTKLGFTSKQAYVRALLVVRWVRGFQLARLITDRIKFEKNKKTSINEASLIREVMKDVEEIARYQAPRLLSCYNDLLVAYFDSIGRVDLKNEVIDITVYLELGVNQKTQISLMGLGMSRTASVMLSELIPDENFEKSECVKWLLGNSWQKDDLPELVKNEIEIALENYCRKNGIIIDAYR
ncbi:DEAD/DEAH box helicase [Dickeya zeae]|uniref:DEAD/DEAH box helicase n=1 Tax=Dickeya zeae TaxID=204042 RepID=UPI0003A6FA7A|nr:DEAD/DEAH box helicase [Dickeya zeae]